MEVEIIPWKMYMIMELFLHVVGFKGQMEIYQYIPTLCQFDHFGNVE
jgi:hypothetical protein